MTFGQLLPIRRQKPDAGYDVAPGRTRVQVDLTVVDAFQVVAAIANRLGYFEGTANAMRRRRIERGDEKPSQEEEAVVMAIAQLRRAEKAMDAALMAPVDR